MKIFFGVALLHVISGICLASTVGDELINNAKIMRPRKFETFLKNNPNIDLNYQNEDGETALMVAMFNNKQGNVKTLLEKETLKLDLTNGADGSNALHFGCSDPNGNFDAVELFLKHLANPIETRTFDVDALNSKGKTAWELCSEKLTKRTPRFKKYFEAVRTKSQTNFQKNVEDLENYDYDDMENYGKDDMEDYGNEDMGDYGYDDMENYDDMEESYKRQEATKKRNDESKTPTISTTATSTPSSKTNPGDASGLRANFITWFLSFFFLLSF